MTRCQAVNSVLRTRLRSRVKMYCIQGVARHEECDAVEGADTNNFQSRQFLRPALTIREYPNLPRVWGTSRVPYRDPLMFFTLWEFQTSRVGLFRRVNLQAQPILVNWHPQDGSAHT